MGSTSVYIRDCSIKNIREYFIREYTCDLHKPIYVSMKFGQCHMAMKYTKDNRVITYALIIKWSYSNNEMYYKSMDETCGPCYYNTTKKNCLYYLRLKIKILYYGVIKY